MLAFVSNESGSQWGLGSMVFFRAVHQALISHLSMAWLLHSKGYIVANGCVEHGGLSLEASLGLCVVSTWAQSPDNASFNDIQSCHPIALKHFLQTK